ncbi:hypothetical protein LTR94_009846 [Friedmanniomyces endolithicus]|nr:hypothetical protein LTR94_009846 [Friedmanniomyces endolithicus]KAK0854567.1 hypothetical protein LTR03_002298 [Friedmanniomyces endolithicus]
MESLTHLSRIHAQSRSLPKTVPRLTCARIAKLYLNSTTYQPVGTHTKHAQHDSPLQLHADDDGIQMANGEAYIKSEPNEFGFDPNQFIQMNHGQNFHNNGATGGMNINPASLANGNAQNYGSMSNGFHGGNSGIADDELLDLQLDHGFNPGMSNYASHQAMQQQNAGMYSHTPDGAPIQSPFTHDFNFAQFRGTGQQQQRPFTGGHSMPQRTGSFRPPHMQHLDRKISNSRSPATPSIQTGEDFQHPGMQQIQHRRQQGSMGGTGWDSTPSHHSWNEMESSPFASPANGQPMHAQITEVLKNSTHHHKVASSLPARMEGNGVPGVQTQEAKRRRRRESHNAVERRRRDNINERIHDLGTLVPQHRLEDEKVRKHLQTNAPLSPTITNAAGGQGRRATGSGSITQGLPADDKEKGPNKGDILNGSVAWARDLMWYTHFKLRQEQEAKDLVQQLGGVWPFEQSDDEKRMHSEICEVLNRYALLGGFPGYSRAPGSGLRVPGFTNVAGDTVNGDGQVIGGGSGGFPGNHLPQSLSPGFQSGGSGMSSGQMSGHQHQQPQYWSSELKEEDEWTTMEMH